jgi:hypothetical protein
MIAAAANVMLCGGAIEKECLVEIFEFVPALGAAVIHHQEMSLSII